jgi:hypothetical protein
MNRRGFFSLLVKGAAGLALAPLVPAMVEPVNLLVPMTWEPSYNKSQVDMIKAMLANAIQAHDDMIERAIFSEASHDIRGLQETYAAPRIWEKVEKSPWKGIPTQMACS